MATLVGNIAGPTGAPGVSGPTGAVGPSGASGPDGATTSEGSIWGYSGANADAIYPSGGNPQAVGLIALLNTLYQVGPAWADYGSGLNYKVCPTAGLWLLEGQVAAGSGGWGANITAGIWQDGVMLVRELRQATTPYANMSFSCFRHLNVGDRIALVVYNGQTGAMTAGPNIRTNNPGNNLDPATPQLGAWLLRRD